MKQISIAASGDSFITMKQMVHSEPTFIKLRNIIRDADVAFTNLEMLLHDYERDCIPAAQSGGTYTRAPPGIIDDLKWFGFDLYSTANNHSLDYMYGGLRRTIQHLKDAGVTYAGTGENMAEARSPAYKSTPKGRVALISATSSFAAFGRAGSQRRDMRGRPGINSLRYESWYEVDRGTLDLVKKLSEAMDQEEVIQPEDEDTFHFLGNKYTLGNIPGRRSKPNKADMEGNLESIRHAARQADWVLFSLHAHEAAIHDVDTPADFIGEFGKAALEAGAHAVIGHGHHGLRGLEIHEGRPLFYSLGDFIFQNQTLDRMPSDFYDRYGLDPYSGTPADPFDKRTNPVARPGRRKPSWFGDHSRNWRSVVPLMKFKGDRLKELLLYPIELGQEKLRSQRGRPQLVEGALAEEILGRLGKLSEPYGTEIYIKDSVGIVKI